MMAWMKAADAVLHRAGDGRDERGAYAGRCRRRGFDVRGDRDPVGHDSGAYDRRRYRFAADPSGVSTTSCCSRHIRRVKGIRYFLVILIAGSLAESRHAAGDSLLYRPALFARVLRSSVWCRN